MELTMDIFKDDAFSLMALTDAINKIPYVPGQIGRMGLFQEEGVSVLTVAIEEVDGTLILIPTKERGGPASQFKKEKRKVRNLRIPHIPLEQTILADEIQGVRAFGKTSEMETLQGLINRRLAMMAQSFDATLEHHYAGAIKGIVYDADGSTVIYNLFTEFGVSQESEIDFDLDAASPASGVVRKKCNQVIRLIEDNLGAAPYEGIKGLCSPEFFDDLTAHKEVRETYQAQNAAQMRERVARREVFYGGISFEEYRGKVGSVSYIAADKCHFFPTGSPGLFRTVYGPADFNETVNTMGLPRYAKIAVDPEFQRWSKIHAQSNPLVYCTRPKVLIKAKRT